MDISKVKDVLQKLSFLKSYMSLIWPLAIVLVAVILFLVSVIMSNGLNKQMEKDSVTLGKRVVSQLKNAVPKDQWKIEQQYQKAYENDVNHISLLTMQSTQREPLNYSIFPKPKDTSTLIFEEFGKQFCLGMESMLIDINARDCPSDAEIDRQMQKFGVSTNRKDGRRSSKKQDDMITDILCRRKAESTSVYINASDLAGYNYWSRDNKNSNDSKYEYIDMERSIEDCWYWQLGYWIVEDVIDTVSDINSGSNKISDSSVKRVLEISFSGNVSQKGKKVTGSSSKPGYVRSQTDVMAESCTARMCDADIDVVHFKAAVLISTKSVLPFMQQLCTVKEHEFKGFTENEPKKIFKHNQITILESNVSSISLKDPSHELYRYGEDAVVKLELVCEYIFNKKAYDELKPESVKTFLSGEKDETASR